MPPTMLLLHPLSSSSSSFSAAAAAPRSPFFDCSSNRIPKRTATLQQPNWIGHGRHICNDPLLFTDPLQKWSSRLSALFVLLVAFAPLALASVTADPFQSVPPNLSGEERGPRVQRPKSRKAAECTQKCVGTCIRGGAGAPGEGPLNVRRPLVVFKEGFRTRQYCLVECSDICNLIGEGDDGP